MLLKDIKEKFPFLSVVAYGGAEYIGIICNQDSSVTSMYIYSNLRNDHDRKLLIDLGNVWWWESNRTIPINIFLRKEISKLNYCIFTMNSKDVKVSIGPCVNLNNMNLKRVKRKSIQLIKKVRS
tara:strand:+ start:3229 stop:3600 length:372 start_codon:yes stop_codon:yes gene_type:complete